MFYFELSTVSRILFQAGYPLWIIAFFDFEKKNTACKNIVFTGCAYIHQSADRAKRRYKDKIKSRPNVMYKV